MRPFIGDDTPATKAIVVEQASFGATSGLAQLAGYINMRIDVFIVSFVLGARELGLYSLTVNLAELMWQVSGPLCMAAFPRIGNSDDSTSAAFTAKLIRHIFLVMIPAGIFVFFAGPPLLVLAYGSAFAASGDALRWILPGVVAYSVEVPLGYFLLIRLGRPWLIVAIQSASVVVCAVLTLLGIHRFGINGAAARDEPHLRGRRRREGRVLHAGDGNAAFDPRPGAARRSGRPGAHRAPSGRARHPVDPRARLTVPHENRRRL